MPSQIMQFNSYQKNRPATAAGVRSSRGDVNVHSNSSLSLMKGRGTSTNQGLALAGASEQVKRFRSDFPNLPGFSKFSGLRPQSPKVSSTRLFIVTYSRAFHQRRLSSYIHAIS
jgi:hypothetical protein